MNIKLVKIGTFYRLPRVELKRNAESLYSDINRSAAQPYPDSLPETHISNVYQDWPVHEQSKRGLPRTETEPRPDYDSVRHTS